MYTNIDREMEELHITSALKENGYTTDTLREMSEFIQSKRQKHRRNSQGNHAVVLPYVQNILR